MSELDARTVNEGLVRFLDESPSMFHSCDAICRRLDEAGFVRLREGDAWEVAPGSRCYVVRNGSSVAAFRVGSQLDSYHFQLVAAHGDSPTYKVKSVPELEGHGSYLRLDVEPYGGMLDHTWLDRPLGLAGRVLVRDGAAVRSRLVRIDRDVCLIPSLAIHMAHESGLAPRLDRACDLMPLFSAGELGRGDFDAMVAESAGADPADVLARDLFLVAHEAPRVWGQADEFLSAGRLDDLQSAYAGLTAFLASDNPHDVSAFVCFDNEEVGSNTKQGAMSTFLADCLACLNSALGRTEDDLRRAVAGSMLVSCDNAHALHPAHAEKHDPANRCLLNGGIVVKEAANQHYCTDAFSRAVLCAVLDDAGVPHQTFANRSDMAGGGTLGNLSNMQVSMHGVDVGMPQLAMHSVYETTGAQDTALGARALLAFYDADLRIDGAEAATLA